MISSAVTVNFRTVDGTAVSSLGGDYTLDERTITFEPTGNNVQFVTIQTLSDDRAEMEESFTAELFEPSTGVTITEDTATVLITDTTGRPPLLYAAYSSHMTLMCLIALPQMWRLSLIPMCIK